MKVKALPLAVAAAIAAPGVALADGPSVYGRLNVSYEMVDVDVDTFGENEGLNSNVDNWQLISNSSRFGVKGDAAVNDGLKVIYLIEWGLDASDDKSADLSQRDRYVGLAGDFGTVQVGKYDSPLKKAQGKIDMFNDLAGDISFVLVGENRLENAIQYSSPKMGGVQFNLLFQPGEEYEVADDIDYDYKDGPADSFSTSVTFEQDNVFAAIAYDSEVASSISQAAVSEYVRGIALLNPDLGDDFGDDYGSIGARFDTLRLVGQFKADALQIGVLLQTAENSNDDELGGNSLEQDAYVLSAGFAVGANLFKAQYSSSTTDISGNVDGEIEATAIGFGVDHSLTKQTTLFAYYNMLSYEYDTNPTVETTKDNLGVGIIHNF